jgi:aminoglycoside phosphotransferase (APT) family kinase protein
VVGDPGPVIGTGRAATVYDIGNGRVLRRYRIDKDMTTEAEGMRWVRAHGVPVPEVFDVDGPDLVMERIDGPSLLAGLATHPHRLPAAGRVLADLHRTLDDVPAPDFLPRRYDSGGSEGVVHGDLHPDNVMMSADGPVLIDWSNVCVGDRGADLAQTWIVVAHLGLPASPVPRVLESAARRILLRSFLAGVDRERARSWLRRIADSRLEDPNLRDSERARLRARVLNVR